MSAGPSLETVGKDATGSYGLGVWFAAVAVPLGVVALVLFAIAGLAGANRPSSRESSPAMAGMLGSDPLKLASVAPEIAAHYTYAESHEAAYSQIPCYCGCEQFLAHRNLYDCFVRADGRGWDAHASGCGVCIGEAATARRLLEAGATVAEVRDGVINQFGSTPPTSPAQVAEA